MLKTINYLGEIFNEPNTDDKKSDIRDAADMPDLESEESAAQRTKQKGQGLNILTPD